LRSAAPRWAGSPVATKPTPGAGGTCCRRFTSSSGAASERGSTAVAHNVAASHIVRMRRASARLVDLEALETEPRSVNSEEKANQQYSLSRLLDRIYRLRPLDRQVILLWLEGEPAAAIAEVTGLSAAHVATKIHRIKKLLVREFSEGNRCREITWSHPIRIYGNHRRKNPCG